MRQTAVPFPGARAFQASIAGLAVLFLALHLPYLPASLEDLDSINFGLGVRSFDVAHHQPHPPGYPVFIVLAKATHAVVPAEHTALALVSVIAAALGVLALAALFRQLDGASATPRWSVAATVLAMTTPLYWFTAVRPLSDSAGLAAALAVQAMTLGAASTRGLAAAAFCAGLATGLRSQVVWLTVPLLIFAGLRAQRIRAGLRAQGSGLEQDATFSALSPQPLALALIVFVAGVLLWFVPLVLLTGGPAGYWGVLFDQGAEDFGNIQMLWHNHGVRDVRDALYYALVAPWAAWPLAAVVLVCAAIGVVWLWRHQPRALTVLAVAFVPYVMFDLLFQETFTGRYALPLVVPIAYLAASGLRALPWDLGLALVVALAMSAAHVGGTSIAAYSRAAAPAFRLLDAMRLAAQHERVAPVLALDRREALDLRGPRKFLGSAQPQWSRELPAPPQHEWLEAVNYWNGGGRAPVWFVVDPRRTSIDLVQHGVAMPFEWPLPYPVLLAGVRPNDMNWYRVDRPEWYVGEGWSLTPEAAGVAMVDGRDLAHGSIAAWVSRSTAGGALIIGGRSFDPVLRPRLTVTLNHRALVDETLMPGAFLRLVPLPQPDVGPGDYSAMTVTVSPSSPVAIEQFDASGERPLLGFGDGWHEQEFDPRTGRRWRWLSERGELRVTPSTDPLLLHIAGESPRTYFDRGSRLKITAGDRVVFDEVLWSDFSRDVRIEGGGALLVETDQTHVPAERSGRTLDRRRLGLKIVTLSVRKAF